MRGATSSQCPRLLSGRFQSTLPVRGATDTHRTVRAIPSNFNPRSPCGERPWETGHKNPTARISIHAPRAGSDAHGVYDPLQHHADFNPRSPCGERQPFRVYRISKPIFQSTLPVRGATPGGEIYCGAADRFQSTLPVRGATAAGRRTYAGPPTFQSTLPVRGATGVAPAHVQKCWNFNPRSPCGERLHHMLLFLMVRLFQSTLPVRGATLTAANVGADAADFNPRSPCGERQDYIDALAELGVFQSTLPVRGAT